MGQDKKVSMFDLIVAFFNAMNVYEKTDGADGTFDAMSDARKAIWEASSEKRFASDLEGRYQETYGPRGHYSLQMEQLMQEAIQRTLDRCQAIRTRIMVACAR